MNQNIAVRLLRYAAILGNILYILWILYNGLNEGFSGTMVEMVSYIGLILLLGVNVLLLSLRIEAQR